MTKRKSVKLLSLGFLALSAVYAFQRPFREYPGIEYNTFPLPSDYQEKTEWAFARLMYPQARARGFGFRRGGGDWREGNSMWTQDYPRADRHFSRALRRLTRIHVRSVEQPVNLDDGDDVENWPWLYAVQVGQWRLTDAQAAKLREYLLRGGFFMCDDFWGEAQWENFMESMRRVFPDRPVVDIPDDDPIFHSVYDLDDRYQVPGARYIQTGVTEKCEGCPPRWRGIYDDRGRVMVAMTFDSDLGDSWEWADDPGYDEKFSALGIRIAVNYIVYAMTH
ncbi:MAG TPA: DUF4159 domain-containing protein [Bryobacteraceae bacterium]|nr:DUF4159 domain-containing protein [Bryobacteraceae bacterium]